MEIIEREESVENVYELVYNEEEVKNLMNKIARDCTFKKSGNQSSYENGYGITAENMSEAVEEIEHVRNSAGYKLFENIDEKSIKLEKGEHWEFGFPFEVHFKATKVLLPYLYFYLDKILKGDIDGYKKLNNYLNNTSEYVSYDEKEGTLARWVRNLINSSPNSQIDTYELDRLAGEINIVRKERDDNPNFNFDLLKQYYLEALDLFTLKLIRRTEYFENGEVKDIPARKR